MILDALSKALGQMGDPRFRGVLIKSVGLTLAALAGLTILVQALVGWLLPETLSLPWIGDITWADDVAVGATIIAMILLSTVMMAPVASAVISLFLDDVADAVEAKHYPNLTPAPRLNIAQGLLEGLRAAGVLILANLIALVAYILLAPAAPLIFVALNGYLLGREYFQLIAVRRLGAREAKRARRCNAATIWAAGALMALPLTVPILNLLIPVVGAAAFTHLYHRLVSPETASSPGR